MSSRVSMPVAAITGLMALTACTVVGGEAAPEPDYTVVQSAPPFEIREYGELVVVKTSMDDGSRAAFGRLFDYISGENGGTREIAMTAPVLNAAEGEGTEIAMTAPVFQSDADGREMIFVLTEEFTIDTAPVPTSPAVKLATIAPRRMAVASYSGSMNDDAPEWEAKLRAWMDANDVQATGPAEVAGYNPPWTLPAYRRNEVLIAVAVE